MYNINMENNIKRIRDNIYIYKKQNTRYRRGGIKAGRRIYNVLMDGNSWLKMDKIKITKIGKVRHWLCLAILRRIWSILEEVQKSLNRSLWDSTTHTYLSDVASQEIAHSSEIEICTWHPSRAQNIRGEI